MCEWVSVCVCVCEQTFHTSPNTFSEHRLWKSLSKRRDQIILFSKLPKISKYIFGLLSVQVGRQASFRKVGTFHQRNLQRTQVFNTKPSGGGSDFFLLINLQNYNGKVRVEERRECVFQQKEIPTVTEENGSVKVTNSYFLILVWILYCVGIYLIIRRTLRAATKPCTMRKHKHEQAQ